MDWLVAVLSLLGCSYFTGTLGLGLISLHKNRTKPSVRSKRFGLALGVVNLFHGIGVAIILGLMMERPPPLDVLGFLALGGAVALGLGIGGTFYAARARP